MVRAVGDETPLLLCTLADEAVINLIECPSGKWTRPPGEFDMIQDYRRGRDIASCDECPAAADWPGKPGMWCFHEVYFDGRVKKPTRVDKMKGCPRDGPKA